MSILSLKWQDTCVAEIIQWAETQTLSGDWLLIQKRRIGGYVVTRFGSNKILKELEVEMSSEELEKALLS